MTDIERLSQWENYLLNKHLDEEEYDEDEEEIEEDDWFGEKADRDYDDYVNDMLD